MEHVFRHRLYGASKRPREESDAEASSFGGDRSADGLINATFDGTPEVSEAAFGIISRIGRDEREQCLGNTGDLATTGVGRLCIIAAPLSCPFICACLHPQRLPLQWRYCGLVFSGVKPCQAEASSRKHETPAPPKCPAEIQGFGVTAAEGESRNLSRSEEEPAESAGDSSGIPVIGLGGSAGSLGSFEVFFAAMPADERSGFRCHPALGARPRESAAGTGGPAHAHEGCAGRGCRARRAELRLRHSSQSVPGHPRRSPLSGRAGQAGRHSDAHRLLLPLAGRRSAAAGDRHPLFRGRLGRDLGSAGDPGRRRTGHRAGPQARPSSTRCRAARLPPDWSITSCRRIGCPRRCWNTSGIPTSAAENRRPSLRPKESREASRTSWPCVLAQTGCDFRCYKKSTILRRIERRMGLHRIADVARVQRPACPGRARGRRVAQGPVDQRHVVLPGRRDVRGTAREGHSAAGRSASRPTNRCGPGSPAAHRARRRTPWRFC